MTISDALMALSALASEVEAAPLDAVAWLPPQIAWLSHDSPEPSLLRLGNRQGKTFAGAGELLMRARGDHLFKEVPPPPVRLALVCFSLQQSVEVQRVIWELVDKRTIDPSTEFSNKTGFKGHKPVVEFLNGSTIAIYGNAQGAGALAGAEFDYILLDEPPAPVVYDECVARVINTDGRVGLTLTPINGPPLPWLRALCEEGKVRDYHSRLTPESQISPMTGKPRVTKHGRPWDAAFIAEVEAATNPIDLPIRVHGGWESRSEGQFFMSFDPVRHAYGDLPRGVTLELCLGLDYASADRDMGLCAVLSAVIKCESEASKWEEIYAVDEVVLPGATSMAIFATRVLDMLGRHSIRWAELDAVFGDNPVKGRFTLSSNKQMANRVSGILGMATQYLLPRIESAKEGAGASGARRRSKDVRCRWMYGQLALDRVRVHPRCKHLTAALGEWDYTDKHPAKDVLDAWMYGLRDHWKEAERYDDLTLRIG